MKIAGAIFDLDGTLLDSMSIWKTVGEDYLRTLGIEPDGNLKETLKTMSLLQAGEYLKQQYGIAATVEEIMQGVNSLVEHFYTEEAPLKAGVADFLEALSHRGVRMCIATATDRHLARAALARNGILKYFGEIFTCTSVGCGKDQPDIFEAALAFLGTPKMQTLVFEDALHAAQTAKGAGFCVAAVLDSTEECQAELKALADFYIENFRKAEGILL